MPGCVPVLCEVLTAESHSKPSRAKDELTLFPPVSKLQLQLPQWWRVADGVQLWDTSGLVGIRGRHSGEL